MNKKEAEEMLKSLNVNLPHNAFAAIPLKMFLDGYEEGVKKAVQQIVDMVPELSMEDEFQVKNEILKLLGEVKK